MFTINNAYSIAVVLELWRSVYIMQVYYVTLMSTFHGIDFLLSLFPLIPLHHVSPWKLLIDASHTNSYGMNQGQWREGNDTLLQTLSHAEGLLYIFVQFEAAPTPHLYCLMTIKHFSLYVHLMEQILYNIHFNFQSNLLYCFWYTTITSATDSTSLRHWLTLQNDR